MTSQGPPKHRARPPKSPQTTRPRLPPAPPRWHGKSINYSPIPPDIIINFTTDTPKHLFMAYTYRKPGEELVTRTTLGYTRAHHHRYRIPEPHFKEQQEPGLTISHVFSIPALIGHFRVYFLFTDELPPVKAHSYSPIFALEYNFVIDQANAWLGHTDPGRLPHVSLNEWAIWWGFHPNHDFTYSGTNCAIIELQKFDAPSSVGSYHAKILLIIPLTDSPTFTSGAFDSLIDVATALLPPVLGSTTGNNTIQTTHRTRPFLSQVINQAGAAPPAQPGDSLTYAASFYADVWTDFEAPGTTRTINGLIQPPGGDIGAWTLNHDGPYRSSALSFNLAYHVAASPFPPGHIDTLTSGNYAGYARLNPFSPGHAHFADFRDVSRHWRDLPQLLPYPP